MSTLVAQTISNGTVSTSTANVVNGAKAWVNFNGNPTAAIRASYNVSSLTRNNTGDYTINFTNAFADVNYAQVMGVAMNGNTTNTAQNLVINIRDQSTSSCRVYTGSAWNTSAANSVAHDTSNISVAIFR
jgi:hypothetical protein